MQIVTQEAAQLSARVTNLLRAIETLMEITPANKRRDDALLELLRAAYEDAEALASYLN